MIHPTPSEKAWITAAALAVGARPDDLNALINFESGYNPNAKNPYSSARGLLQFTNAAAQDLGYTDSSDFWSKNTTFSEQIKNGVIPYLKRYAPYPTQQSLYMAVFYPAARTWPLDQPFPPHVQAVNPGIKTVRNYVDKVNSRKLLPITMPLSIILVALLIYLFARRSKDETPGKP